MDSIIIETNLNKWIEEMSQYDEKDLINFNWKANFIKFNRILSNLNSDYEIKINCFYFLTKMITMNFTLSDTEIKSYFNDIVPALFVYTTSPNPILSRYSLKILKTLLDFNENLEYILKYALKLTTDGNDWQDRYGGLLILKCACEGKRDFLIEKKNYCKKVIEGLILGYKNSSETIKQESAETLTAFLSKLPNYAELTQMLPSEMLSQIYQMQSSISTDNNSKATIMINKSIALLENKHGQQMANEENEKKKLTPNELFIDKGGLVFGIFPSLLITKNNPEMLLEEKIANFNQIYLIFNEKRNETTFLRFASSFFKWISKYINFSSVTISSLSLQMMNQMIAGYPGVNLITSLHITIPVIISTFSNETVSIRELAFSLLTKIVMIIPTSQMIPYIINALSGSTSWLLINECLRLLDYIFNHLNEIYNDLEWAGQNANYDINIFLEVLKLFDHQTPKIALNARKVIKMFGETISGDAEHFAMTLSYYINDSLNEEVKEIFYSRRKLNISVIKKIAEHDIANQRVLSSILPKSPLIDLEPKDDYKEEFIYDKVKRYESKVLESKLNVDENLMENLLDSQGRSIKLSQRHPVENYPNYEVNAPIDENMNKKTKIVKKILKSRLKRYNDPTEVDISQIHDKNYDYAISNRNSLSPVKKPKEVYPTLFDLMKNKLNWEKQFKAINQFRKILVHHRNVIKSDIDYFWRMIDALLECAGSIRSHLAKNAFNTLSEVFEITEVDFKPRYGQILKTLFAKIQDPNPVISEEAMKAMLALIMFSNLGHLSNHFFKEFGTTISVENITLLIHCFSLFLKYHKKKVFNHTCWNKMMIYVTEQYATRGKDSKIKTASVMFYKILREYFNNDIALEEYLKSYMTELTLNNLLFLVNISA